MKVGVPTEVKNHEYRVALTPSGARELTRRGHDVLVQAGAGAGSYFSDDEYRAAGADVVDDPDEIWATAKLLLKVKEPVTAEFGRLQRGQVLFTYLHLAAGTECANAILASGTTAIAYETVQEPDGTLPLLAPMSEVAGRLSSQVGAYHLMKSAGGRGILMGGVPGVARAKVVVIGGGVSGSHAATIALGMGADVTVLDLSAPRLRQLDVQFQGRVQTLVSSEAQIEREVRSADLVIGAVLIPGAKAPTLVSNELVSQMRPGSVLVDIAIDQGGCFEDSRPTTHAEPTYEVHNSVFYCVANMPGAVARSSTLALTNVTLPYVLQIVERGWRGALANDTTLARGLNAHAGALTNQQVGSALGITAVQPELVM